MNLRVHGNWFDHLRLALAAMVLLSHSPELLDGNRHRELLTQAFGTASFGELAVCGFLILSGYLISGAWDRRASAFDYLGNRVLRIFPAFVAAFAFSVLIAGALGAESPRIYYAHLDWPVLVREVATLSAPQSPPTFGPRNPGVNGSMWTIQMEFSLYLIAPLLSTRWSAIAFWMAAAALVIWTGSPYARGYLMFASGVLFRRFDIKAGRPMILASAAGMLVALRIPALWELGVALFATPLVLSLGLRKASFALPVDVSYGAYLYGWPIIELLIRAGVSDPWLLCAAALVLSLLAGWASWALIERGALKLKRDARGAPIYAAA